MVDTYSKTIKFEEAEDHSIAWSDQELDVPRDNDNVVEDDLHVVLLGCDGQNVSADAVPMYVNLNGLEI